MEPPDTIERHVLGLRKSKKGNRDGRKIRQHWLENGMSVDEVPVASTTTAILNDHDRIDDDESQ